MNRTIGTAAKRRSFGGRIWAVCIGLTLLATLTVLAGCGAGGNGAGSGDSASSGGQEKSAKSSGGEKEQSTEASEHSEGGKLGHPSLGEADAPVVMTEYSDYQ